MAHLNVQFQPCARLFNFQVLCQKLLCETAKAFSVSAFSIVDRHSDSEPENCPFSFSHRPTRIPLNPHETRQNPNSSQSNPPMFHHTSCISPFTMISHHISKSSTLPYIYIYYKNHSENHSKNQKIQKSMGKLYINHPNKHPKNNLNIKRSQKNPQKIPCPTAQHGPTAAWPRQPLPPPPALRPKPRMLWQRPLRPPGI